MDIKPTTPTLFAEERREQILTLLRENTKITVIELCEGFDVSPATIRSDLRELEGAGKLRRTHGGAILAEKAAFEPDYKIREIKKIKEKQSIAKCAAKMIDDGDTIIIDTGTTTAELAKCLEDKRDLTVVTNDLQIAAHLESHTSANVILTGGILRRRFQCTVGPIAIAALTGLNVDKVFMGANAFSIDKGFTTPDIDQNEVKKAMLSIASERILLVDSSKFNQVTFLKFADLGSIDKLIMDDHLSEKAKAMLLNTNENTEIIFVP